MAIIGWIFIARPAGGVPAKEGQIKRKAASRTRSRSAHQVCEVAVDWRTRSLSEATGNSAAVAGTCGTSSKRVVVRFAQGSRNRFARVEDRQIDAAILAKLTLGGFSQRSGSRTTKLKATESRRAERMGVLEKVVRHQGKHFIALCMTTDPKLRPAILFGKAGKKWVAGAAPATLAKKKQCGGWSRNWSANRNQIANFDMTIHSRPLKDPRVVSMMTIPGAGRVVA